MKKTNKAVLVFSGLTLGVMNIGHTPAQKPVPTRNFIEDTYLVKTPLGMKVSGKKSELRKQEILNNIRNLREKIRLTYQEMQAVDKICNVCIQNMIQKTQQRLQKMQEDRAHELGTAPKYVKVDVVARRNAIVVIDNFEI